MEHHFFLVLVLFLATVWGQDCDTSQRRNCGYLGINQEQCESKGCCWAPSTDGLADTPSCIYKSSPLTLSNDSCQLNSPRTDCGYVGIDQQGCQQKGCCWNPKDNEPWCFFKSGPPVQYIVHDIVKTQLGVKITLEVNSTSDSTSDDPFGTPISPVVVEISAQTSERLHMKIYDPNNKRWEIPTNISPAPADPASPPATSLYTYNYPNNGEPFSFTLTRSSDKEVLFDTSGNELKFYDQYLSISTKLPSNYNLYGIGEHVTPYLRLQPRTYTLWTYDTATPQYLNLYGSHPFYLDLRTSGSAHGVYLRNSNGMDIVLDEQSLTYNVIGGILDFYFFLGPQPEGVVQQYQEVIGRPHMPPYWALGFHQCRFGYHNVQDLKDVVQNYTANKIPLDTMWTDIDYMDEHKDFTLDPQNFPKDEMNTFVNTLHQNGQHYVVIIDPGIKVENGYSAYDDGIKMDIFIKDSNGDNFKGKVWPGITVFPDFFNPKANQYWENQIADFLTMLPVDGLWIDMNEISNFCNGECTSLDDGMPLPKKEGDYSLVKESYDKWLRTQGQRSSSSLKHGKVTFDPNNPPYAINNQGNKVPLNSKTTDMSAKHYGGVLEYNAHNLFGLTESIATNVALEKILKSRSLVISRSTFPGSGAQTGHWTGDNHATWEDLFQSISDILNFQMYGIPLIGADICGFISDTTKELCSRWMELGAFYPFSRNHNTAGAKSQEPYIWSSVADISRKVLAIRYSLLPYYYTQFYKAHRAPISNEPAATVIKPLFFEFPTDKNTFDLSKQFLVGNGFMVSPVLDQGATKVDVYFPSGKWYDFYTLKNVTFAGQKTITMDTPIDHIQLHVRGGAIIPMQEPALTTTVARNNSFSLLVALDDQGMATGDFFWDDGRSLEIQSYVFMDYSVSDNTLTAKVSGPGYQNNIPSLDTVTILGLLTKPSHATLNGQGINGFNYDDDSNSLKLTSLAQSMTKDFTIKWM